MVLPGVSLWPQAMAIQRWLLILDRGFPRMQRQRRRSERRRRKLDAESFSASFTPHAEFEEKFFGSFTPLHYWITMKHDAEFKDKVFFWQFYPPHCWITLDLSSKIIPLYKSWWLLWTTKTSNFYTILQNFCYKLSISRTALSYRQWIIYDTHRTVSIYIHLNIGCGTKDAFRV